MQQFVWVAVIVGAFVLFWLPVVIAMIRRTDSLGIVVLLTVLTPLNGVTWFAAWIAAFALPRRRPAPPRRPAPLPRWEDDPRFLYGGAPPGAPVDGTRREPIIGAGASSRY